MPGDDATVIAPITGASTYKQAVYRTLYDLIQSLEMPPGTRLVEQDLSDRFGVSKTPIREALLLLEKDQLIEMVPHNGATVSWLSLADYEQQLFILDALELPALKLVSERASAEDFARWADDVKLLSGALERQDFSTYRGAIASLHREMFSAAGYPRLTELIGTIQRALYRYGVLLVDTSEQDQQRELEVVVKRFELVAAGDARGATRLIQRHHAVMLKDARARITDGDPRIMRFLIEGQSAG
jgi:DNA-binding GntR family transcriptional regulator